MRANRNDIDLAEKRFKLNLNNHRFRRARIDVAATKKELAVGCCEWVFIIIGFGALLRKRLITLCDSTLCYNQYCCFVGFFYLVFEFIKDLIDFRISNIKAIAYNLLSQMFNFCRRRKFIFL